MKNKSLPEDILSSTRPTLIEVQAEWSGESHLMDFILENIEGLFKERINVKRIDFEDHKEFLNRLGIECPPAFLFIKNGQVIEIVNEVLPKKNLIKKIHELLSFQEGN